MTMANSTKYKAMAGDIPVYCSHDEIVDIMKVIPNPKNPNMHPERQIEILSQVIKAQGWRKPITVSKRSGFVVAGHGRLQAALLLGAVQVPVDYQSYENEAEEWADLVADNRISELSNINEDLLIDILNEINDTDIDTILTGYEYHEIDDLINDDEVVQVISDLQTPQKTTTIPTPSYTNDDDNTPINADEPHSYEDTIEKRKSQTGEIDLEDFAEENYKNQCPKCKFMW